MKSESRILRDKTLSFQNESTAKHKHDSVEKRIKEKEIAIHHRPSDRHSQIPRTTEPLFLTNGFSLIASGKLPTTNYFTLETIAKSVKTFSSGENHYAYVNTDGKLHFQSSMDRNVNVSIMQFFANKIIERVFCTPYTTFVIDSLGQLFGFGLNDRGQLGKNKLGFILSPQPLPNMSQKVTSREEIFTSSNAKKRSKSHDLMSKREFMSDKKITNLNESQFYQGQKIVKITGGPLHTVIITSEGRVFESGQSYKSNSINSDNPTINFTQIPYAQKVKDVICGVTSTVFLTKKGKVLVYGLFGECEFYNSPTEIDFEDAHSIGLMSDMLFVADHKGHLFRIDMTKKIPKSHKLPIKNVIKIYSTQNLCLFETNISTLYGIGSNENHLISQFSNQTFFEELVQLDYLDSVQLQEVQCSQNFLMFTSKTEPMKVCKKESGKRLDLYAQSLLTQKLERLELENKTLKLKNFSFNPTKSIRIQTDQQPKDNSGFNHYNNLQTSLVPRAFKNNLQIPFEEIILGKKIAQGGYGVIYRGKWKKTDVAVKIFKLDQRNQNSIKDFISECQAMQVLRHPNIVMFLGTCTKAPHFAIVLQYCSGGTLWSLLQNPKNHLSWKQRLNLALQLAKAMNYLHDREMPILHRDLKSLNVLLDENCNVKLADFGWTKALENYMTAKIGTYQWMAPEVIQAEKYTEKADVFSFAIILWEIASRQAPYRNIQGAQVAYEVANKQLRPTIPIEIPEPYVNLMTRCWHKNPTSRPCFSEIIDTLEEICVVLQDL